MVLTERGVASRVRARRFGARHGKAVEASQGRARSGWVWFRMARRSWRVEFWRGEASFGEARRGMAVEAVMVRSGNVGHVESCCGLSMRGEEWQSRTGTSWQCGVRFGRVCYGLVRQSMRGVALLGGAMHGTVRHGEVGCGRAVVEWRVLVRLVLASFGEVRLGRARQSRC